MLHSHSVGKSHHLPSCPQSRYARAHCVFTTAVANYVGSGKLLLKKILLAQQTSNAREHLVSLDGLYVEILIRAACCSTTSSCTALYVNASFLSCQQNCAASISVDMAWCVVIFLVVHIYLSCLKSKCI